MASQASPASSSSETKPLLRNDGILIDREHLEREEAVKEIIELARSKQYAIIGSPPATGKTALLQLVQKELRSQGATVKKLQLTGYLTIDEIKGKLNQVGFTVDEDDMEHVRNTWLLLDDAQNWYEEEYWPFWQFLMKGLPQVSFGRCFVIVAATYDLSTPKSPVVFATLPHFRKTAISADEVHRLFGMHVERGERFELFFQNLKMLSKLDDDKYHIGVIVQGLLLLEHRRKSIAEDVDENVAAASLRSGSFVTFLERCFRIPERLPEEGRSRIVAAILNPKSKETTTKDPMLVPYVQSGMLTEGGQFSCAAAQWFYNQTCFPRRAGFPPNSLDELVRSSVASLSASRLRNSFHQGFPKEAAFQHFFNEAMSMHLTVDNFLIPELNTWAIDSNGEEISGELDFYVDGHLQWCVELLRNGDKIGEHLARFDPHTGKYREVKARQYLIIDCRPPKQGSVAQIDPNRCTLYFDEDYTRCRMQMRTGTEEFLSLQP